MNVATQPSSSQSVVRRARVGDVLPAHLLGERSARRIEATAIILPGRGELEDYLTRLGTAKRDFAEWDGRFEVLASDGAEGHRVAIADRYGQVYEATDAVDPAELPDADALREWFKFLATACPECGVLDDPTERDWVP